MLGQSDSPPENDGDSSTENALPGMVTVGGVFIAVNLALVAAMLYMYIRRK